MIFGGSMFFGAREKVVVVLSGETFWTAPDGVTQIDLRLRGGNAQRRQWNDWSPNIMRIGYTMVPFESVPGPVDLNAELAIAQATLDQFPRFDDDPKPVSIYTRYFGNGKANPAPEDWPHTVLWEEDWVRVRPGTDGAHVPPMTGTEDWSSATIFETEKWTAPIWEFTAPWPGGHRYFWTRIRDVQRLQGVEADGLPSTAFGYTAEGGVPTNPPYYDFATSPELITAQNVPVEPGDTYPISAAGTQAWVEITYFA